MRARVLGSAAGGGFPQWNCGCPNCAAVRRVSTEVDPRTQDSVLVTAHDGRTAYLLNASPDIGVQIARTRELSPRGVRHSPLAAVVLTNADLDHCLGLLSLRERPEFSVYATREVQAHLRERNTMFRALESSKKGVVWRTLVLDQPIELLREDGLPSGVELTAFPVPGKVPKHLEGIARPSPGDNVGLIVRQGDMTLAYATSVASLDGFAPRVADATCLVFDGTFYASEELAHLGIDAARAEDMAHLPVGGERGSLNGLMNLPVRRRVYSHLNNTNPMLVRRSREREHVRRAGWEIAYDGMELVR